MSGSSSGRIGRRVTGVPSFIVHGETYCTGYGRIAGFGSALSDILLSCSTKRASSAMSLIG